MSSAETNQEIKFDLFEGLNMVNTQMIRMVYSDAKTIVSTEAMTRRPSAPTNKLLNSATSDDVGRRPSVPSVLKEVGSNR